MMDPITRALVEYNEHLNKGGDPVHVGEGTTRTRKHKLHPSGLGPGLCDRKSCYAIMEDTGKIKPDIEHTPELLLFFRVGHIFQDFVSQALKWKGALVATEIKVEDENFVGRPDQIVDPRALGEVVPDGWRWLIDVKAVKANPPTRTYYPKRYYIAQLEQYAQMLEQDTDMKYIPMLYVVTRIFLSAHLYYWRWLDGDCTTYLWGESLPYKPTFEGLQAEIEASKQAQIAWLHGGKLPIRCGNVPDAHPFLCVNKNRKKTVATPSCKYYSRCWETDDLEPYDIGVPDEDDDFEPL